MTGRPAGFYSLLVRLSSHGSRMIPARLGRGPFIANQVVARDYHENSARATRKTRAHQRYGPTYCDG